MASKILLTSVYPDVSKGLSDKKVRQDLINSLNTYMNHNSTKLTTKGPIYRTTYGTKDRDHLYNACSTNENDLRKIIKTIPSLKSQQNIVKEPYNTLCALASRFAIMTNDDTFLKQTQILLILSLYPTLHAKYFRYEPNEDIMDYTINNLSEKFIAKKEPTFYHAMLSITINAMDLHKKRLVEGTDDKIIGYVLDVKTRISSLFKNIAREFYDNHKKNLFLGKEQDDFDPDQYKEYDSNSYAIERITNKVVLNLLTEGVNYKLVDISAKMNTVSISELRNYLNQLIITENREDIRKIVEALITLYLQDGSNRPEDINTTKFVLKSLDYYRSSNIINKNMILIKDILDKWMKMVGTMDKTNRLATINNFRRAFFLFFVYSIQYANQK